MIPQTPPPAWRSLADGLRLAARLRGDVAALTVVDAQGDTDYGYAELDRRVTRLARLLAAHGGARALLLMDGGIDYVCAFYACLYAGVVAVPVYPPDSANPQHVARLEGIAADAGAAFVLTTAALADRFADSYRRLAPQARIVAVDTIAARGDDAPFDPVPAAPGDIAFLQYTSGSTGSPKGVMVSHGNLVANQTVLACTFGTHSGDVYVSWLPLFHDMGLIGALMQALFTGLRLVLMSPRFFLEHPFRWLQAIERHRATVTGAPDSAYRLCADHVRPSTAARLDLSSLRVAYSGSESVRDSTLRVFAERFAAAGFDASAFLPCYGLAEATLMVSGGSRGAGAIATRFRADRLAEGRAAAAAPDEAAQTLVACGVPPDRHEIRIADPRTGRPAPAGRIGEIEVRGPSVSAGYWNRPAASADMLRPQGSWLRTGDLGFRHDGQLYIAARRKDLIIVRGRNLYPQDIERAVEEGCDFVRKGRAAAFAAETDDCEGIGLALEIPPSLRRRLDASWIVDQLARRVFDATGEAPSAIALLNPGGLPKTSSGKVQRDAARRAWHDGTLDAYAVWAQGRFLAADGTPVPAAEIDADDEIERILLAGWQEALGRAPAGRDAHFFASGGSSLSAARLAAALGRHLGARIELALVFEFPVFAQLALALARSAREPGGAFAEYVPDAPIGRTDTQIVSHAQQRQLFAARLDPRGTAYHIALAIRLRGPLDRAALADSLAGLVAAHEVLRTVFPERDGTVTPHVRPPDRAATLIDLTDPGTTDPDPDAIAARFAAAPFDLARGPLVRFGLLRRGRDDAMLAIALHHIAADGWSMRLLIDDWVARYRACVDASPLPVPPPVPEPLSYRDYAAWQGGWLHGAAAARQLAYWTGRLADAPPPGTLPFERPQAGAADAAAAGRVRFGIPPAASERLGRAARRAGATPFMLTLAAWHAWLHRATGQADLCVGMPVANRRHPATQPMVGFFTNTLVMRSRWTPLTDAASMLAGVKAAVLGGLAHQELPFDRLVERLDPPRRPGEMPWLRTMFNHLADDQPALRHLPGLAASCREIMPAHVKVPLALDLRDGGDGALRGILTFARQSFAPADAERIVAQYHLVLDGLVAALLDESHGRDTRLADLALLPPERLARLGRLDCGDTAPAAPPIPDRVARHARVTPDRIAVVDGDCRLTYAELVARARRIAAGLARRGVAPGQLVAIHVGRSADFVAAMLGVLETGAAYVPVDPDLPPARIAQLLAGCRPACVLDAAAIAGLGATPDAGDPAPPAAVPPAAAPHPDRAAYVIHTSGSTGTPKGVVVSHGALANYVDAMLDRLRPPPAAAFAMVSTPAADLGHTVLFGALASGGTLHLIDRDLVLDADRFAAHVAGHGIDILKIVPSHLDALLTAARPADVLPRAALVLGGEPSRWTLVDRIAALAPHCRVFNHYGPTEATVGVAMQDAATACRDAAALPLGTPLRNLRVRLLDAQMTPVETGAAGELYLGGAGLAQFYLDRPGLTAERFVPDPFEPGARLYRSGDRARRLADGSLEFLGRGDDQLKIRGHRVEPGEIAAQLRRSGDVAEAVVLAAGPGPGPDPGRQPDRLAAFVTARPGRAPAPPALRRWLAARLPGHMVPATLLVLDRLPLTANGKIDRAALLGRLDRIAPDRLPADTAPLGATERRLAAIWTQVLEHARADAPPIGRGDNFFAIGGHSLAAMRMLSRIRAAWPIDLALGDVLGAPDLRALAATIDAHLAHPAEPETPAMPRHESAPLSPLQQRIWIVDQLADGRLAAYNMAFGLSFAGPLDLACLDGALADIVARHDVLRACFPSRDGMPSTRIAPTLALDLAPRPAVPSSRNSSRSGRETWRDLVDARLAGQMRTPFDLATGPLIRTELLRLSAHHHVLILALHHIVADGGSIRILMRELRARYLARRAGTAPTPRPAAQYADYAAARHAAMTPRRLRHEQDFWRGYLKGVPDRLALPADRPRPARALQDGDALRTRLDAATSARLRALAARHRTTPFVVLLAAFQAFLHDLSAQRDLVVGIDVADRDRPEFEDLIGFFVNVLPVRSTLSDPADGFPARLDRTRRAVCEVLDHRALPFDRIVEAARIPRRRDANPLVQVLFVLRDLPGGDPGFPDLRVETIRPAAAGAKVDLAVFVEPHDDGDGIEWVFSTALFDRATIAGWSTAWQAMLGRLSGPQPDRDEETTMTGFDDTVAASALPGQDRMPLVLRARDVPADPARWLGPRKGWLEAALRTHGAILFRGFPLPDAASFERFAEAVSPGLYGEYGDLPRKEGGRNTYRSTPYPERRMILFHNESSHLSRWPRRQFFFCEQPSPQGGATPIVDCRRMLDVLSPDLVALFERRQLMYVRTFVRGLDVPWQDFFNTDDRAEVERRCRAQGTACTWLDGDSLQTRTVCPGVIRHPLTGERSFFNQIQLHHAACLDPQIRADLAGLYGEDRMPRQVYFGDGSPIGDEIVAEVGAAYEACAVRFDWQRGDMLMLDNMLVAHARDPYRGPRRIVVAMSEMTERATRLDLAPA